MKFQIPEWVKFNIGKIPYKDNPKGKKVYGFKIVLPFGKRSKKSVSCS
jgi:hypothetical protein